MQTAYKVLTDPILFAHIVGFQPGLPYALLDFEPEVYAAEATPDTVLPRGASLFHALLTNNGRMLELLFRVREEPYYAATPRLALDGLFELVCKRGRVEHLDWLKNKPGVPALWPSSLLRVTLDALEYPYVRRSVEDLALFLDDQKRKAEWLMQHHPEACVDIVRPGSILISTHDLRAFLVELLAANVVELSAFTGCRSRDLDVSLLELLLRMYPSAITPQLVKFCASCGNREAVKFLHHHTSGLAGGLFTPRAMDFAATSGHLDVVRFLHEHRTEGCTEVAINRAVERGHLDVVKFLVENGVDGLDDWTIETAAISGNYGSGDLAMTQYVVEHYPEPIPDPTSWALNEAVKYVRSMWATQAIESDDPVEALRAAVIQLTDVEAFQLFHNEKHPVGCTHAHNPAKISLLTLAIEAQNHKIVAYLVANCKHVRSSIGLFELSAASVDSCASNLELLDLLMTEIPSGEHADIIYHELLQFTAERAYLPVVKMLLERGVPCTVNVLQRALRGERFAVPEYLMDTYPELITTTMVRNVACRGELAYLFKLHASHRHLWDGSVVSAILCSKNSQPHTTWELLRSLYERCSSISLQDRTARWIWTGGCDVLLLFMWLVWQDPKIATSLAAADRGYRLRLYSRLRELVPSLFVDVPASLPWCCQLRFLRQRVESGDITVADVERARNEATLRSLACDMDTSA